MFTFPGSDKFQGAIQELCLLLLLQPIFRKQYPPVALTTFKILHYRCYHAIWNSFLRDTYH